MECNKDEALRAKNIAENKMINNDFEGGKKFALKAQKLFPKLESVSQMLAVCDVHCAAKTKINDATKDLYGILQVESLADVATIKKQYRKLALVLHPDKNQFPGAESAFKLIGEAHMILSDNGKRSLYDYKYREPTVVKPQNPQSSQFGSQNARPLFWTICIFSNSVGARW
ncbi:chaperone protein dnaJ 49-like [Bidens hawaiensis]|uniref:chaperone protein dnaJ 49-like n=1 Tax=Bidens hawaiensis TaxID=980011 RepID=UPI00404A3A28